MRRLALSTALLLGACTHPYPALTASAHRETVTPSPPSSAAQLDDAAPELIVESPAPKTFLRTPEVEVRGRVRTYDGRAWLFIGATPVAVRDGRFVAPRVAVDLGDPRLRLELTDGLGRKQRVELPLVVESPNRPRGGELCRPQLGCLRYEVRGVPRRDPGGQIVNAVVVLTPFGSDEHLDDLWPDLVGPGRALDPTERYVVGVAPAPDQARRLPDPEAVLGLCEELLRSLAIDRGAALIGASSYGSELVLRALALDLLHGPVLICAGHDRLYDEPAFSALRKAFAAGAGRPPAQAWATVARALVPLAYGAGYLADPRHASSLGLSAAQLEAQRKAYPAAQHPAQHQGDSALAAALADEVAAHFASRLSIAELGRRLDASFALAARPVAYPALSGRRVVLVGNRADQLVSVTRMRALAVRLAAAGARVSLHELDDALGHSAFFLRTPLELEAAIGVLLAEPAAIRPAPAPAEVVHP